MPSMKESYSTVASERGYQDVDGHYQLPNDSVEHQRLDAQSQSLVAMMKGRPFHPPFTASPKKILDCGCGTGAMTALLASAFPNAQVIGVDIAAVPESRHERPPNVEYVQGDVHELIREGKDPRFALGSFDYVFQRLLILGMVDWPGHIQSVSSLLKPGGWLEVQEVDMRMQSASNENVAKKWWHSSLLWEDAAAFGLDPHVGPHVKGYLEAAGLQNVQESVFEAPPVSRPDRPEMDGLGDNIQLIFLVLQNKVSTARRSKEEVEKMEADLKNMFAQDGVEDFHFNFNAVIGQKA